jgi:hypothetical protein
MTVDTRQGVGYSHPDRLTAWDEMGPMTGWRNPSWLGNDRVMLSTPGRLPNADVVTDEVIDNSTTTWTEWFTGNSTSLVNGGEMTHQGTKLAFNVGRKEDAVRIYKANGQAPVLPEACYEYPKPVGGKAGTPTWSPDGTRVAWAEGDGVRTVTVPDFAGGCTQAGASPSTTLLIGGATEPDRGPADVPAPLKATLAPKKARLRSALRKGLVVEVAGAQGKITLTASWGGKVVARGSGTASVRLRFTKAAKRSFARSKKVTLTITGAGATARVTLKR